MKESRLNMASRLDLEVEAGEEEIERGEKGPSGPRECTGNQENQK